MNITVSLETAKKLKEAGWDKPTYLIWSEYPLLFLLDSIQPEEMEEGDYYAPSLQEILEELPNGISISKDITNGSYSIQVDGYYIDGYESAVEAAAELWLEIKKGE